MSTRSTSTRRPAVRLAAALAVLPLALAGCSGSVSEDGVDAEIDAPEIDAPEVPDVPDVDVTTK